MGRVATISKTSRQTVNAYGLASNSKVLLTHNALFLGKDPNVTSNSKKWMLGYVENCIITGSSRTPLWKDRCETGQNSYCVKVQDSIYFKKAYTALTFNVTKQERYFLLSPMTITLLIKGTSSLMASSMGTGAIFSPPAVIINSARKMETRD